MGRRLTVVGAQLVHKIGRSFLDCCFHFLSLMVSIFFFHSFFSLIILKIEFFSNRLS